MTKLIGVTGYRRCGKDSACKVLVNRFGFKKYAFADALRSMAAAIDPIISMHDVPDHVLNAMVRSGISEGFTEYRYTQLIHHIGYELAKDIPDFRRFLQRLGTEGVRNHFGPTAWVAALELRLAAENPPLVCISDLRFRSEADWIIRNNGIIIRVVRPGFGGDDPHPSEVEVPHLPADREITATSLEALRFEIAHAAVIFGCVPIS